MGKPRRYDIGYRHMCRFHSGTLPQLPALSRIRYLLHVDSDAALLCNANGVDPLEELATSNAVYGLFESGIEDPMYSKGWSEFLREYILLHDIQPAVAEELLSTAGMQISRNDFGGFDASRQGKLVNVTVDDFALTWGTGWEVLDLDFFNSARVREFTQKVERSLGHYRFNWGDHLIRAYQVQLFAPLSQVRCFDSEELPGRHGCMGTDAEFGSDTVFAFESNLSCPLQWTEHWIWGVPWDVHDHSIRPCHEQCYDVGCDGIDVLFKLDGTAECRLRSGRASKEVCLGGGSEGDAGLAWIEASGSRLMAHEIGLLGATNRFQLIETSLARTFSCASWNVRAGSNK